MFLNRMPYRLHLPNLNLNNTQIYDFYIWIMCPKRFVVTADPSLSMYRSCCSMGAFELLPVECFQLNASRPKFSGQEPVVVNISCSSHCFVFVLISLRSPPSSGTSAYLSTLMYWWGHMCLTISAVNSSSFAGVFARSKLAGHLTVPASAALAESSWMNWLQVSHHSVQVPAWDWFSLSIADELSHSSEFVSRRKLCSASSLNLICRLTRLSTYDDRALLVAVAGSCVWNSLLPHVTSIWQAVLVFNPHLSAKLPNIVRYL